MTQLAILIPKHFHNSSKNGWESNMPDYQIIVHEDLVKKLLAYRLLHSKNDNEKRTVQRMKLIYSQMGQPLTEPEAQKYGKLLFDSFDPSVQLQLVETTIATIAHCYTAVTRSQSFNNPVQVFVEVDKKRGKNYTSSINPQELDLDHYIAHAVKSGDEVGVNNMENYAFELLSQQIHLALKWYEQNPLY